MEDVMKNAVMVSHGKPVTTSMKVAEIFGKRHDNVVCAIEKLTRAKSGKCDFNLLNFEEIDFMDRNFEQSEYKDDMGRTYLCYNMTRDGFVLLVMGFTGKTALEFKIGYLEEFNRMEAALKQENMPVPADFQSSALASLLKKVDALTQEVERITMSRRMPNGFLPPSLAEVAKFCFMRGSSVNPEKFVKYYTERNWVAGKNISPIEDWKQVIAAWETNKCMWNTAKKEGQK